MTYIIGIMKAVILFLFFSILTIFSQAQIVEPCVTTHVLEYNKLFNSSSKKNLEAVNLNASNWQHSHDTYSNTAIIPIVVHVVYLNENENISDEAIKYQIENVNQSFKDVGIEFCLANIDPNGSATTGIKHTQGLGTLNGILDFFDPLKQTMKYTNQGGDEAWPSNKYLNIWICNLLPEVEAFAQMPGDDKASDGIVINSKSFSSNIICHQIKHWLGINAEACKNEENFNSFTLEEKAIIQSYLYTDKLSLLQHNNSYCQQIESSISETIGNNEVEVILFPNPVIDKLSIEIKNANLTQLSIINSVGEIIFIQDVDKLKTLTINTSSFNPGIYFIKTNSFVKKFIKA